MIVEIQNPFCCELHKLPATPNLTEIIATLKRSTSPTLVVEGKDDFVALSDFEIENVEWGFTVLPVHGKDNVFRIIQQIDNIRHPALAFLVDLDCWIFTGTPDVCARNSVFHTDGYSIENDLLRDGDVRSLLRGSERQEFDRDVAAFARFFAVAAHRYTTGKGGYDLSIHPSRALAGCGELSPEINAWMKSIEDRLPQEFDLVIDDPMRGIRGKSLVSIFTRYLSRTSRLSKYSGANLLEIGASRRGPLLKKVETAVSSFFEGIGVKDAA